MLTNSKAVDHPPLSISESGLYSGSWLSSTAAADLYPTSTLRSGKVVSSSLFRGGVSASGISALRLVDGVGRGIGYVGVGPDCHGTCPQVHTLENVVAGSSNVGRPPRRILRWEYSKIVPQKVNRSFMERQNQLS
ncbi:hypothetical protein Tco_0212616 [Tanacetum coccineum]